MQDELKTIEITLRSIEKERRKARFTASTAAVDSYGEIVVQDWILERFNSNPIVLYNHQRFGSDLPIGTATVSQSAPGAPLECEISFVSKEANPLAEQVWNSVLQRSLRAVSVGFRPHSVAMRIVNDQEVAELSQNELYEISVTPLPANPEALAKARAKSMAAVRAAATLDRGAELAELVGAGDFVDAEDLAALGLGLDAGPVAAARTAPKGVASPAPDDDLSAMVGEQRDETTSRALDLDELLTAEGGVS